MGETRMGSWDSDISNLEFGESAVEKKGEGGGGESFQHFTLLEH
jgi:hypothetical protein